MKTLTFISVLVVATFTSCGGSFCDQYNAANDRFFAGKTECKSVSGGVTLTSTKGAVCKDTSKCSSTSDQKSLDTYVSCLSKATPCTDGNEEKANNESVACVFGSLLSVSAECAASIK